MTKQETFDCVAKHLLTQMEKSIDENGQCFYRGPDGLKCAVGVLIPDELYTPDLEGQPVASLENLFRDLGHDIYLLETLQGVHDEAEECRWKTRLKDVARNYGLNTEILNTL